MRSPQVDRFFEVYERLDTATKRVRRYKDRCGSDVPSPHLRAATEAAAAAYAAADAMDDWGRAMSFRRIVDNSLRFAGLPVEPVTYPPLEEIEAAEQIGRSAFRGIAARCADALRGTKGWPDFPRCPYRLPIKVKAWTHGFNAEHSAFMDEWYADMDEAA